MENIRDKYLRNGNKVILRNGTICYILNGNVVCYNGSKESYEKVLDIFNYKTLTLERSDEMSLFDIMEVYDQDDDLIWKNTTSVLKGIERGTRVQVRNNEKSDWIDAIFISYHNNDDYPTLAIADDKEYVDAFKYGKIK